MRWTHKEWKAVCAAFRLFEQQIGRRGFSIEYVDTRSVAMIAGVSMDTARNALNKLVATEVLYRVGGGSPLYRYRK